MGAPQRHGDAKVVRQLRPTYYPELRRGRDRGYKGGEKQFLRTWESKCMVNKYLLCQAD